MIEERGDRNAAAERAGGGTHPVWVIDDDRSIRWVFEKALAREGIGHRTFATAREALDRLDEESPEVVVSDIRMPGLSGLEFMQALKERLPATPVMHVSTPFGILIEIFFRLLAVAFFIS